MVSWFTTKNEIIKTRGLELFFSLAFKKSVGNSVENVCKAKDRLYIRQAGFFLSLFFSEQISYC